ncbi:MAG: tRNA (adenosine(37)-N6)-threonylcarbamoyltransferase complex transferase subunit TsaD [Planctomycetes bacterium]|nr:tRNA (adenosine(37)-N6)-threonylcarbamoyltransferase complex transferase subunit TsaD [Planctomycetota bacterium]
MSELVLGIESSCDETAAAVVAGGREIRSSVVESQVLEHARYGGVVPEIAGRSHLRVVMPLIDRALAKADVTLEDIGCIAVTSRPGLIGSLLVGLSAAKALAFARDLPLVCVNHIEAHAYAATMENDGDSYPSLALVVSGGHTALYVAHSPFELELLSRTLDDAAGEAFDKVAYLLGLPYPGGPSISKLAASGNARAYDFPRCRAKHGPPAFSFSGLKTAVLYHLRGQDALAPTPAPDAIPDRADVAASFEEAVADSLVGPTVAVAVERGLARVLVVGGVACNRRLREVMRAKAAERGIEAIFPSPAYCTDNAAMIAGLGWHLWKAGRLAGFDADASPQ